MREVVVMAMLTYNDCAGYQLAIRTYLDDEDMQKEFPRERVEGIVVGKAMDAYDGASNGNRTRGGMKKANDM